MRCLRTRGSLVLAALVLAASAPAQDAPTEYEVKAAFLYNFAKFVEWPPDAWAGAEGPLVIGVLGDDRFGDDVGAVVRGRKVGNRDLIVKKLRVNQRVASHVLFISASESRRLPEILRTLAERGVLTVSDAEDFTRHGGIIGFREQAGRLRFEINPAAAHRVGLKLSSKLLQLATVVQ